MLRGNKRRRRQCCRTDTKHKDPTPGSFINSVDAYRVRSVFASTLFDIIFNVAEHADFFTR
jgi:hypothetical protein